MTIAAALSALRPAFAKRKAPAAGRSKATSVTISPAATPSAASVSTGTWRVAAPAETVATAPERDQAGGEIAVGLPDEEVAADGRHVADRGGGDGAERRQEEGECGFRLEVGQGRGGADPCPAALDPNLAEAGAAQADQAGDGVGALGELRHHRRAAGHHAGAVAERGVRLGQRARNDHRLQHGSSPRVPGGLEAALDPGLSIIENAPVNSLLRGGMPDLVPEAKDRRLQPAAPAPPPLRRQLKEALLRRILGGHYRPGERLVELRIAAEFATSQGPVREALRELEATGLVTNVPRRGTYVAAVLARRACARSTPCAARWRSRRPARRLPAAACDLGGAAGVGRRHARGGAGRRRPRRHRAFGRLPQRDHGGGRQPAAAQHLACRSASRPGPRSPCWSTGSTCSRSPRATSRSSTRSPRGDAEHAARVAREHQDYFERLPTPGQRPR